jgi:hypothetical protein
MLQLNGMVPFAALLEGVDGCFAEDIRICV